MNDGVWVGSSSIYNIVIRYKDRGLIIIDEENKYIFDTKSSEICMYLWTASTDVVSKAGIDYKINEHGHAICIIDGVDEV